MSYHQNYVLDYFWRTHSRQEIDRIEIKNEEIAAFEYKYGKIKAKSPTEFSKSYPDATFEIINQDNYLDYIL